MATIQFSSSANMHNVVTVFGNATVHDADHIVIVAGAIESIYTGSFSYDSTGNVFGTLTGLTNIVSGTLVASVTGLNVSANLAEQLIQNGQLQTFFQTALGGNDTITLTAGTHTIDGYGGYNIVIEPSTFAGYTITNDGTVQNLSGSGSQDTLFHIQGVQFADGFYDTQAQKFFSIGSGFVATDITTGKPASVLPHAYSGPVAGLQSECVSVTPDNLNISVSTPNWFIHSGSGTDAIAVSNGTNVIDGGTGSNFLTGGSGTDTFFVDDRIATSDIWSTVVGFHSGDAATVWGVTPQGFSLQHFDNAGAAGFTGLTLSATAAGKPNANLTLSGFTSADLTNGRLSVSFGTDPGSGSNYMLIQAK
jgi:Ca2+-binding RTX toxin-like protein